MITIISHDSLVDSRLIVVYVIKASAFGTEKSLLKYIRLFHLFSIVPARLGSTTSLALLEDL